MTHHRRRVSLLVVALVLASAISNALAQGRPAVATRTSASKLTNARAQEHLVRGQTYFDAAEFDRAIEEWSQGALVEPHVVWNFNFGQANRAAGRLEKAKWNYERFVAQASDIPELARAVEIAQRYIREIDTAVKSRPRGTLDDVTAGREVAKDPTPAPTITPAATPASLRTEAPSRLRDWTAWGLLGGGVVVAGAGVALHLNGSSLEDDANAEPDQTRRRELLDDADVQHVSGLVVAGAGALCVVVGVIKLAIPPDASPTVATVASRIHVGPSQIALRFTF